MKLERYSMSFTTGSLFHPESVKLAGLFLKFRVWNSVRDEVLSDNLLQARTLNTSKRVCCEIISRLKTLDPPEIDLLVQGTRQEQGYLLWMAICRRYKLISDFAVEIIRERYITLKTDLHYGDYNDFFSRKLEWHPELDQIQPATYKKLRQVLFKILREVDLLTANNTINAALLSRPLLKAIPDGHRQDILVFPAFESDIRGLAQ